MRDGRWETTLPVRDATGRSEHACREQASYSLAGLARLAERRVGLAEQVRMACVWLVE